VVTEIEETSLARAQSLHLRGDERLAGIVRLDERLDHRPPVPARIVASLTRVGELDKPVLAGSLDSKTAVGTATEPVVQPNAVDDRPVNPTARVPRERDTFPGIEPRGRFEKTYRAVRDEIFDLDPLPDRPRSDSAGYRPDEVKVSDDALVMRVAVP
jgi:hypothetical protein